MGNPWIWPQGKRSLLVTGWDVDLRISLTRIGIS
jgi:hypothetical protein